MATQQTLKVKTTALPTFHHLNHSQSQRILWLLEELGIDYNFVFHSRNTKTLRAQDDLKEVQSLGKAPILITSDGRTIVESNAIAAYLLKTYDTAGKFAAEDWIKDETLTSFAGSTLGPVISIEMLFAVAATKTPWPLVYIARALRKGIQNQFTSAEFQKDLRYLEGQLGDAEWFNGKMLGRSDVMLSWPLDLMNMKSFVDFEKDYPKLTAWRERIEARPAWVRGMEKGKNEYDLGKW